MPFRVTNRLHLGVRSTGAPMPTSTDHARPFTNSPTMGLGRPTIALVRQIQRCLHVLFVVRFHAGNYSENSLGELPRIKRLQIIRLFAKPNKLDR